MSAFVRCTTAFLRRDFALAASYRFAFWSGILSSVFKVLMLWLPAQLLSDSPIYSTQGGFLPYAIVGASALGPLMASYGGFAEAIRSEQTMGTLESLLMTPTTLGSLVIGASLWSVLLALLDSAAILVTGALAFGIAFRGNWGSVAFVMLLTALTFSAIGMASAAAAVVFKRGDPFRVLVGGASLLLGGVVYPVEIFPRWVHGLSLLLPITHATKALRGILLNGHRLADHRLELLILGCMVVVGLPASTWLFSHSLRRARRDGTLLHF